MNKIENLTGVNLTEKQKKQFEIYLEALLEANKKMNLTAITDRDEILEKHFADSLSAIRVLDFLDVKTMIDVGTGAGFPGIPLQIMFPHLKTTLLDSLGKRVNFLNEVIQLLELENIHAIHGRAETISRNVENRETYDLCVSRAVSNLATLSEYCLPFVRKGGYFLAYKSTKVEEEIDTSKKALYVLGGEIVKNEKFTLAKMERSLLLIEKQRDTPEKYPRKEGLPAKTPLK